MALWRKRLAAALLSMTLVLTGAACSDGEPEDPIEQEIEDEIREEHERGEEIEDEIEEDIAEDL